MARLIELLFFAFIIYLTFRRIAAPFRRGFAERERERNQEQRFRPWKSAKKEVRIDRTNTKDAEFKDLN